MQVVGVVGIPGTVRGDDGNADGNGNGGWNYGQEDQDQAKENQKATQEKLNTQTPNAEKEGEVKSKEVPQNSWPMQIPV